MKALHTKYRATKTTPNGRNIWEDRLEIGFIVERLDKSIYIPIQWSESIAESMGCISLANTFLKNGCVHINFVLCVDFNKETVKQALHTFWDEATKLKLGFYTFHISAVYNNIDLINRSVNGKPGGWEHLVNNKLIAKYSKLKDIPEELIPSVQLQIA